MSRRFPLCWRVHVALIAVAAALVLAAPAEAQGVIGGQLLATGGTVDIVVQPATAVFTSQLFLLHRDGTRENISLNTEVGKHVTVGPFPAGQELVFGITVLNGPTFFIGPASRNPDGIAHAEVTERGVRTFLVGFEDLFGGGDRDYDDNVFQFTGNLAPKPPPLADDHTLTKPTPNPKPNVPPLKIGEARSRLPSVLRKQYGRRYTSRRGPLKKSCYRLSSEKVRCGVGWNTRRHRYSGNATMWNDRDDPDSILFTTSIRRTRSRAAASRHMRHCREQADAGASAVALGCRNHCTFGQLSNPQRMRRVAARDGNRTLCSRFRTGLAATESREARSVARGASNGLRGVHRAKD